MLLTTPLFYLWLYPHQRRLETCCRCRCPAALSAETCLQPHGISCVGAEGTEGPHRLGVQTRKAVEVVSWRHLVEFLDRSRNSLRQITLQMDSSALLLPL
ncbi:uncharacterized protein [Macaca nemestrina]|uniref:uncharacterized protein isoform X4 n=1 Tax=Macaca nemestrina TaxID=9545 RepID=UPI0039B8BB26